MRQALRWRFQPVLETRRAWPGFAETARTAGAAVKDALQEGDPYWVGELHGSVPKEMPLPPDLEALCVDGPWLHDVVVRAGQPETERDKLLPVIESERLHLRALRHADAPSVHRALSDPDTMRYWSRGPLDTLEETRGYVAWNVEADESWCWAITEKTDPTVALGWFIIRIRGPGLGEIGYILVPSARGRGLAREAAAAIVAHPLGGGAFRRLNADVDPDNEPSLAVVEGLGFAREAHLRGEWETHIGIRDSIIFGRLRD